MAEGIIDPKITTSLAGTSIPEGPNEDNAGSAPGNVNPLQNNFPPPKTDKPRPHGCTTCGRSFARLEHLKRHERSHTKEKPFECPECTRCFARRDLLLRHQQKLHMTTTPAARPRAGRRESTSSTTGAKVRKNSSTQAGGSGTMRPRANTISHVQVDANNRSATGAATNANVSAAPRKRPGHSTHPSLCGLPTMSSFEYRGMSAMPRNRTNVGLPKLETQGLPMNLDGNLRTAPAFHGFPTGLQHETMFSPGTVNPAQLHFLDSPNPLTFDTPISPFHPNFNFMTGSGVDDDGSFDWVHGFDNSLSFGEANEMAIAESSPSAMSTGSPAPENVPDVFGITNHTTSPSGAWQPSALSQAPMLADYSMETSIEGFPAVSIKESISSGLHLGGFGNHGFDSHLQSPHFHTDSTSTNGLQVPFMTSADTPTTTTASIGSSNRHSSVTSVCTDAITDTTRAALLATLTQPQSGHGHHRTFSSPTGLHAKSTDGHSRSRSIGNISLPSTYDLQRYISAYIQYFHPHLPFLHIPTLSFNSPAYTNNLQTDGFSNYVSGIAGGGGCLILAMAAIGALFEFDNAASKELFELAKKMIQAYLEERRKADISTAMNGRNDSNEETAQNTPLWLVQSMLLNVIYGHNCGDKMSADIASTHCAALVSLARAADLARPPQNDSRMAMHDSLEGGWSSQATGEAAWHNWKVNEERKRTLYAVYILSSMLVSAYNHSPALTNSEILLDLPCEEDVWAADSYEAWISLGGKQSIAARSVSFADALGWLLGASQRQPTGQHGVSQMHHPMSSDSFIHDAPPVEIPISTFGCLILIHSLHNYIWETRQRHLGRQWTSAETEAMHGHIEPALVAWQNAWSSHPHHSLERPNPYGMGPLSADSIPLLDLAYVRLFVNLGRSKEAFWHRDWEQMSYEIARGAEIVQHAESGAQTPGFGMVNGDHFGGPQSMSVDFSNGQSSKRERHMRKAAFHAANSLCASEKMGMSFATFDSRELPLVSAMCVFDCAQVLAEWVTTVQERVGRFLGILGRDPINFQEVPGIMLLDAEDIKLLHKIDEYLASLELKSAMENASSHFKNHSPANKVKPQVSAYGSKILMVTLEMLEKTAVWPVIRVMARSLESQAAFMEERAIKSTHPGDQQRGAPQSQQ